MRVRWRRTGSFLIAALTILALMGSKETVAQEPAASTATLKPVSKGEFQQLHRKLTEMSKQKVWSIPWQLSVRKAREKAAREKKPVFLWISSNGGTHPLGPC